MQTVCRILYFCLPLDVIFKVQNMEYAWHCLQRRLSHQKSYKGVDLGHTRRGVLGLDLWLAAELYKLENSNLQ
jgi:hypothetical protein